MEFTRVVNPIVSLKYRGSVRVYVTIQYQDGRLSITGVEGPRRNGDAVGSCGQISGIIQSSGLCRGWTTNDLIKLQAIWDHYHLNDMQAGTPDQMAEVRRFMARTSYPHNDYNGQRRHLEAKGLLVDTHPETGLPYEYGTSWLKIEVPAEVLEWLKALPAAEYPHPWGDVDSTEGA